MSAGSDGLTGGDISGILNIDKPAGMTSHDVVNRVRRLTGQRKAGHAGTLDPMATGVLLLCLGQATRVAEYLMAGRKVYRALVRLGAETDTYDAEGSVLRSVEKVDVSRAQIVEALARFRGAVRQVPPPYSAIRHKGHRLYELARRGVPVQAPPRIVEIERLDLVAWQPPDLTLEVACSPGTYVRSLAHDLGQALGVGAHLAGLARLASGRWRIEDAVSLDELQAAVQHVEWLGLLHPMDAALYEFQRVDLPADSAVRVAQGQPVRLDPPPATSLARAYAPGDRLVALLAPADERDLWQPKKVFSQPSDI
jgi:tRNA pseudouridine55 synthase